MYESAHLNELFVDPKSLIQWAVCSADPTNLFSLLCYTNILCISQRWGNIPNNKIGRLSLTAAILKKGKEGVSEKSSQVQR
ncbi:MAG: hypothetical protein DRG80_01390 [Deltaproteobacteria bacterium]|nr:MAG: hypothetical protein DRG80_01390 [Deltaproteobacteria bacterium]